MRLGISSWTFPWAIGVPGFPAPPSRLSPARLLSRASELGVNVVQIADNLPLENLPDGELRDLRAQARALGLTLELGTRGVEPARLLRYLELCRFFEATLLRTLTHSADSRPDLAQAAGWIGQVLPEFEAAGVVLALENYERHTVRELAGLVRGLGSPAVGVCLDTVNSLGALESPEEVVITLGPLAVNLHVKDFVIERVPGMMGFSVSGRPAGDGLLRVPWLLAEIARHGKDPSVIIEHWPPFVESIEKTVVLEKEWGERSVRYMRSLDVLEPARGGPGTGNPE